MLTNEDIQKLIKAQKEVFATREDLDGLKKSLKSDFSDLQTSVDTFAKKADTYFQEMVVLAHKIDKLEKWIYQIAEKVGLELKH